MNLQEQLAAAKDNVAALERQIAKATCEEAGHRMTSTGHANAGCNEFCHCSIPVYTCEVCGGCDYGSNEEARAILAKCKTLDEIGDYAE